MALRIFPSFSVYITRHKKPIFLHHGHSTPECIPAFVLKDLTIECPMILKSFSTETVRAVVVSVAAGQVM
jgi:hypothetical protein